MPGSFIDTLSFGILPRPPQNKSGWYFWGWLSDQEAKDELQRDNLGEAVKPRAILYIKKRQINTQFYSRWNPQYICIMLLYRENFYLYAFEEKNEKLVSQTQNSKIPQFSAIYCLIRFFENKFECEFKIKRYAIFHRAAEIRPAIRFTDELIYRMARYQVFNYNMVQAFSLIESTKAKFGDQQDYALLRLSRTIPNVLWLTMIKAGKKSEQLIQITECRAITVISEEKIDIKILGSTAEFFDCFNNCIFLGDTNFSPWENDFRLRFDCSQYNVDLSMKERFKLLKAAHRKTKKLVGMLKEESGEYAIITYSDSDEFRVIPIIFNHEGIHFRIASKEYCVKCYVAFCKTIEQQNIQLLTKADQSYCPVLQEIRADEEVASIMALR